MRFSVRQVPITYNYKTVDHLLDPDVSTSNWRLLFLSYYWYKNKLTNNTCLVRCVSSRKVGVSLRHYCRTKLKVSEFF